MREGLRYRSPSLFWRSTHFHCSTLFRMQNADSMHNFARWSTRSLILRLHYKRNCSRPTENSYFLHLRTGEMQNLTVFLKHEALTFRQGTSTNGKKHAPEADFQNTADSLGKVACQKPDQWQ